MTQETQNRGTSGPKIRPVNVSTKNIFLKNISYKRGFGFETVRVDQTLHVKQCGYDVMVDESLVDISTK